LSRRTLDWLPPEHLARGRDIEDNMEDNIE
jgi:hypothetical protein